MKRLHVLLAAILIVTSLGSACIPATIDCAKEEILCVGLVTDLGKISDHSFNQSAWEGIQLAQKEFGGEAQYIETVDTRDYAKNIVAFAELHYDVIVTVGADLWGPTVAAAQTYPNTYFIGVDQFQKQPVTGVTGLIFHEDQAGFLAGALAALMSTSHKVGAVCGTDAIPAIWRLGEGYKAGAAYVDRQNDMTTEVYVLYHPNDDQVFSDPEWGTKTAQAMIGQGADVIFSSGTDTGDSALVTAAQAKLYVIGVDNDQYFTLRAASARMLSSAVKLAGPGVFELIQLSRQGAFPSGNYYGHVGYTPFHDLDNEIPADVREQMEKIKSGLQDGSIRTGVREMKPPT